MSVTIRNKLHSVLSHLSAWSPCGINSTSLTRAPREGQDPSIQYLHENDISCQHVPALINYNFTMFFSNLIFKYGGGGFGQFKIEKHV